MCEENPWGKASLSLKILGVAVYAAALPGMFTRFGALPAIAPYLGAYLLIGWEVLLRAATNIRRGEVFDENFLMAAATVGAFAIGEYPEGVAVMLFYQVGEAFQDYSVARSRKSIGALMDIRPDYANLRTEGGEERVAPDTVRVGETIVVHPGEKIPLDGVVSSGSSTLDTKALTGESMPRDVIPGDEVLSGTINTNGLLHVEVTRPFAESTVSKILELVQNAGERKAPLEHFITKFARYYTPAVVIAAVLVAAVPPLVLPGAGFAEWVRRALVFLVVSCPCALVISIPLGYFAGIGGASRQGILVKGGNYLEALNGVTRVVFDKTGTLTKGVFAVGGVFPAQGVSGEELLETCALAESASRHPIAQSIVKAYGKPVDAGRIQSCEEAPGKGVRAVVGGRVVIVGNRALMDEALGGASDGVPDSADAGAGAEVHVAVDGRYAGHIVIRDELKPDSAEAVRRLRRLGVSGVYMFTGDTEAVARDIGGKLGVDGVFAGLLPQDKVARLEALKQEMGGEGRLAFAGDGINDAPVLARSDIGFAMGGAGSDAAIEAADVVLMRDEPSKVAAAIAIARRTHGIVMQNIVFSLAVKGVILALGALGFANMWMAVFGDVGVAFIAILNAMRALRHVEG
ncbi:MAG: cadmium-translocating P-type ATPase [Acidobacteriota bacterium]|jgi:Cd2+/Zn2+-exporting ATPase|nr:cadmium-translocating P-type ATPase [Acidobacteriota bacterium]